MKKLILLVTTALFVVSFVASVYAAEVKASGKVVSVDAAKNTVVFCPAGTGGKANVTLSATKDQMATAKANVGKMVKVTYDGTTLKSMAKDRGGKIPVGC